MSDKGTGGSDQDVKLEDILKSIRGVIDSHKNSVKPEAVEADLGEAEKEDQVLELINVFYPSDIAGDDEDNQLISKGVKSESRSKIKEFANKVDQEKYFLGAQEENAVDALTIGIMKPLIKEWLDNNLPKIVEKVIAEEIKQLIPKKS